MARRPSVTKVDPPRGGGRGEEAGQVGGPSGGEINNPLGGQSAKERECWKLFQKMTTRGIAVSYDTILRGMLTPTELRIIQKQRDIEQTELDAVEAAKTANEQTGGTKGTT